MASCSGLIVSYDRSTGERLWTYDIMDDGMARTFHGQMIRNDDQLLVASDPAEGHIYSFEETTGQLNWKWASGSGVSSDLMVVEGLVIAVTLDHELVALDVATGKKRWITTSVPGVREVSPTTPTPVLVDGDLVWGRKDGRLSRRRVATGEIIWAVDLEVEISTDLSVHGGSVVFGLLDGRLLRVDPTNGKVLHAIEFNLPPTYRWMSVDEHSIVGMTGVTGGGRELVCVDSRSFEVKWRRESPPAQAWTTSQPILAWGFVLAGTTEPLLYAIDPTNGEIVWSVEVEQSARTIKVVGEQIYIGTFGGTLMAYRASARH